MAPKLWAQTSEVREFYNGARMLAMGGASIAVVNDETALLTNPAGLGKLRNAFGTILDPEIDGSSYLGSIYKAKAFSNPLSMSQMAASLNLARDSYSHFRAQVFPSFVVRNFGFGIYWRQSLDAIMNTLGTSMATSYYDDLTLALGYNLRLWEGRIKIGFAGRAISRIEVAKNLDPTAALDLASNASEGFGLAGDLGLNLTAPWTYLPTISAVVRDVGGTKFTSGNNLRLTSTSRPVAVAQDIDLGVALFPIHANRTRSAITLEYTKMVEASRAIDKNRYYHAGYELNYADLFFFRIGMNQNFFTAGVELASEFTQIQLSTYGENVAADGSTTEDRRFVFKFALRF